MIDSLGFAKIWLIKLLKSWAFSVSIAEDLFRESILHALTTKLYNFLLHDQFIDEIRLVKDHKYGNEDKYGEWDGMVGELVRRVSLIFCFLCEVPKHLFFVTLSAYTVIFDYRRRI